MKPTKNPPRAPATNPLMLAGAIAQSRAVATGAVSPATLIAAQQDAIDTLDGEINAYVVRSPCRTEAKTRTEAGASPGAGAEPATAEPGPLSILAGSSFAVKDNIDVAGLPTAAGVRALTRRADSDAPLVARLKAAGLHCLGKLNMHPMALGASNRNPDYGDCFNPHHAGLTPGGSSGGAGAAVAAGLCGVALGTDTMGSVRIPAAYCGVVGFKPGHETLGLDGVVPLCRMLDHVGLLARRVEDVDAALRIAAPHLRDAGSERGGRWRLAVVEDLEALGATEAVRAAFADGVARIARRQDVECVPVSLAGFDLAAGRRAGLLLCEAELHPLIAHLLEAQPPVLPADLIAMMRYIERKTAVDIGRALARIASTGERLDALSAGFDAVLLPTAPQVAFPMDQAAPANQADFTAMANMNGAPAISLPLPVATGCLPVGIQAIGHRGHDLALLTLARLLEQELAGD